MNISLKFPVQLVPILIHLLLASPIVTAQSTASISGLVTDKNGRALVLANITLTHLPSGKSFAVTTREDGFFHLAGLQPGSPYRIEVSSVGFKDQKKEAVYLEASQQSNFRFLLMEESIEGALTKTNKTKRVKNSGSSKQKYK